ncbi:MAG: hypothetical protein P4L99_03520 [Chthoniobacter sp.]|nr:hypothetical protein [Chthoniobacter sp.]
MNVTRNGKIARLPQAVREELNHRLFNGESGTSLLAWLHGRRDVQDVLAKEFGGRPINAQNLTEWRQGGYREWLDAGEARMLARELGQEMLGEQPPVFASLTEPLAVWTTSRYAVATRRVERARSAAEHWRLLREMSADVIKLRQNELRAQTLELQREERDLRAARADLTRTSGNTGPAAP